MLKRTTINFVNDTLSKNISWKILDIGCGYRSNKYATVIADVQDLSEFYKEKSVTIDNQSNITLLTIMRGIYLKYSNSADNTLDRIKLQIQKLNDMVVQYSLSKMYSNYDMHTHYLHEINSLPSVMPLPQPNNRTNYTYDPSERNDMSGQESKYFDLFSS